MLTLPQLGTMNELAICTNVVPFADLTYRDLWKLHNDSNTFQLERSGLAHILDCETIYQTLASSRLCWRNLSSQLSRLRSVSSQRRPSIPPSTHFFEEIFDDIRASHCRLWLGEALITLSVLRRAMSRGLVPEFYPFCLRTSSAISSAAYPSSTYYSNSKTLHF